MRIGIVTDIHLGPRAAHAGQLRKLGDLSEASLGAFVEDMNRRFQPDLVLSLGDAIEDEGRAEDLRRYRRVFEILSALDAPHYPAVGNHDLVHMAPQDLLGVWSALPNLEGLLEQGRLYYRFGAGPLTFIVLHSHENGDIWIDDAQVDWFREQLRSCAAPVMVVLHHSLADQDTTGNHWFEGRSHLALVRNRAVLRRIINDSGKVTMVINGHLHWNNRWIHEGIPYFTLQSLVENFEGRRPPRSARAWSELVWDGNQSYTFAVRGNDPRRWP